MTTRLKSVDVVTIGVGLTGSLAAHELTQAGLKVVGLERGSERNTVRSHSRARRSALQLPAEVVGQ
jgi:choline dehydrogenase-like flavoprotein